MRQGFSVGLKLNADTHETSPLGETLLSARDAPCTYRRKYLDGYLGEKMDADAAVEPELDSFSLILPLPYRVALILVLGR